jgi:glycosyltransferase involved in cell wall biosynthesis
LRALQGSHPGAGLIVPLRPVTGQAEQSYWMEMRSRVQEHGLADRILWISGGVPVLYPLLRRSHLFLRPTNTDGDAVSVREALYFGVPVVASDATVRPPGTVLFRNRDADDLTAQVRRVLSGELVSPEPAGRSSFDQIWQVYQGLAGGRGR